MRHFALMNTAERCRSAIDAGGARLCEGINSQRRLSAVSKMTVLMAGFCTGAGQSVPARPRQFSASLPTRYRPRLFGDIESVDRCIIQSATFDPQSVCVHASVQVCRVPVSLLRWRRKAAFDQARLTGGCVTVPKLESLCTLRAPPLCLLLGSYAWSEDDEDKPAVLWCGVAFRSGRHGEERTAHSLASSQWRVMDIL